MINIKNLLIVLLLLITVLTIWIFNISNKKEENNNINIIEENNTIAQYQKVTNPHMYFTVKSCVEKYLYYVQQKDADSITKILDYQYIKDFNISKENVFNHVEEILNPVVVTIEEMYVLEKNENEHEYYLRGILQEEQMDGLSQEKTDFTLTVSQILQR